MIDRGVDRGLARPGHCTVASRGHAGYGVSVDCNAYAVPPIAVAWECAAQGRAVPEGTRAVESLFFGHSAAPTAVSMTSP